jgi:hypothetical protein
VVSASPGALGGMRAQIALQISLNKLGLLVIPNSFALGLAHQAFDERRRLKDGNADQNVRGVGAAPVTTASSLAPKSNHSECGTYPDEAFHSGKNLTLRTLGSNAAYGPTTPSRRISPPFLKEETA